MELPMIRGLFLTFIFALCFSISQVYSQSASCSIIGTKDNKDIHGSITINKESKITLTGAVMGLSIGEHAMHIHMFGDLSDTSSGSTAGPHFKIGEIGNIVSQHSYGDEYESAQLTTVLDSTKYNELFAKDSILGRSIVIHQNQFNETYPSVSGKRVSYCVIGLSNINQNALAFTGNETNGTCVFIGNDGNAAGIVNFQIDNNNTNTTFVEGKIFIDMAHMTVDLVNHGEMFTSASEEILSSLTAVDNTSSRDLINKTIPLSFSKLVGRSLRIIDADNSVHYRCVIGVTSQLPKIVVTPTITSGASDLTTSASKSTSSDDEISDENSSVSKGVIQAAYSKSGLIVGIVLAIGVLIAFAIYTIRKTRMNKNPGFQRVYGEF